MVRIRLQGCGKCETCGKSLNRSSGFVVSIRLVCFGKVVFRVVKRRCLECTDRLEVARERLAKVFSNVKPETGRKFEKYLERC